MPVHEFTTVLTLPQNCAGSSQLNQYKFTIRVSWDELPQDGAMVATNFVYEMLPEIDDAAGNAEFGYAAGLFELDPVGQPAVQIDSRNIWDQQVHANDPTRHSPTSPGGCDVQYRDLNNNTVADKKSGEPFRVAHPGPLESIVLNLEQQCTVQCLANRQIIAQGVLPVRLSFSSSTRAAARPVRGRQVAARGHAHAHAPAHVHTHPETFTEVIRDGFPEAEFDRLQELEEARGGLTLRAAPLAPVPARLDAAALSPDMQAAFRNAVQQLVADGTYVRLVRHHMDMSHNMHGSMGRIGLMRFLAWHRRYLVEFERELQRADRILRPAAPLPVTIPYWRWPTPFPNWLRGFLPAGDPDTGRAVPPRRLASPPPKPTASDVLLILNDFRRQMPGSSVNDFVRFTYGLEGFGNRPNGSSLPAHNHVHAWVGGIMNDTSKSPTDPVFWLHHAEVDRLWHIWQLSHTGVHPPLNGPDRILDPWPQTYDDVVDITMLGYTYASIIP